VQQTSVLAVMLRLCFHSCGSAQPAGIHTSAADVPATCTAQPAAADVDTGAGRAASHLISHDICYRCGPTVDWLQLPFQVSAHLFLPTHSVQLLVCGTECRNRPNAGPIKNS
jgi:hypothetical protein